GDTFDLLRLDPLPLPHELDNKTSSFPPALTPHRAAAEVTRILAGHRSFLRGVATVLAHGFEVVFLPGNHDIELQWAPVQEAIRAALRGCEVFETPAAAEDALGHLSFRAWYYHEPRRIWI